MIRRNSGFSLVELLITLGILALVLAGTSDMFVGLLRQFKTQGKIAETGIERIIGLEVLRQDIDSAGYGLPWTIPSGYSYEEASGAGPSFYNDAPVSGPTGTNNNPRAILSGNGRGVVNGSDELVIKSAGVARNATCKKWTRFLSEESDNVKVWSNGNFSEYENLSSNDWAIFLSPGSSRSLDGVAKFGDRGSYARDGELIYGITDGASIRMPFNRADYYITAAYVPDRCADNTGVLVKSIISQSTGTSSAAGSRSDQMPLLDCVADMRVVFRLDTNDDGAIDNTSFDITGLNAEQIRKQVKEVHVSILAHEGQKDTTYFHRPTTIYVGNPNIGGGRDYDIGSRVNYRWKVYNLSVTPHNLLWGDR